MAKKKKQKVKKVSTNKTISVDEKTYKRLEQRMQGRETFSSVISKLLDLTKKRK